MSAKDKAVRRRKADRFRDFHLLVNETGQPVVFLGSKDYAPLFARADA